MDFCVGVDTLYPGDSFPSDVMTDDFIAEYFISPALLVSSIDGTDTIVPYELDPDVYHLSNQRTSSDFIGSSNFYHTRRLRQTVPVLQVFIHRLQLSQTLYYTD